MFEVEGEIGVLRQDGRQVAGVYNWLSRIRLNYTVVDNVKEYKPTKIITALSYWIVEPLTSNEFNIELYKAIGEDLVIMEAGKVTIDFPDTTTIGRRLNAPVSMSWVGYEY